MVDMNYYKWMMVHELSVYVMYNLLMDLLLVDIVHMVHCMEWKVQMDLDSDSNVKVDMNHEWRLDVLDNLLLFVDTDFLDVYMHVVVFDLYMLDMMVVFVDVNVVVVVPLVKYVVKKLIMNVNFQLEYCRS
jgi:hypothetical protein